MVFEDREDWEFHIMMGWHRRLGYRLEERQTVQHIGQDAGEYTAPSVRMPQPQRQQPFQAPVVPEDLNMYLTALDDPAIREQMQNHTAALIARGLPHLTKSFGGGNIPEKELAWFRQNCAKRARATVLGKLKPDQSRPSQAKSEMMDPASEPEKNEVKFRAASNSDAFVEASPSRPQAWPGTPFNPSYSVPATPPDLFLVTQDLPNLSQAVWENLGPDQPFPESAHVPLSQQFSASHAHQGLEAHIMAQQQQQSQNLQNMDNGGGGDLTDSDVERLSGKIRKDSQRGSGGDAERSEGKRKQNWMERQEEMIQERLEEWQRAKELGGVNASEPSSQASSAAKELSASEAQAQRALSATKNMPRVAMTTDKGAPTPSASKPAPEVALSKRDTDDSMSKYLVAEVPCDHCRGQGTLCFWDRKNSQCDHCASIDAVCTNGRYSVQAMGSSFRGRAGND